MLGEVTLTGLSPQSGVASQVKAWQVGQILHAVALSRPTAESMQLKIGALEFTALTKVPMEVGSTVSLKVLSTGQTPTLQVLPPASTAVPVVDVVQQAVRSLMPMQLPPETVLSVLHSLLRADSKPPAIPLKTRGLIEALLGRMPAGEKLAEPAQLRQAASESGLFFDANKEAEGLRGEPRFDLKQSLQILSAYLRALGAANSRLPGAAQLSAQMSAPGLADKLGEARQAVDGGIARIILQQLQSLPQQDSGGLKWVFELPYHNGEQYRSLSMLVEREAKGRADENVEPGWQVELEIDLPELGPVQARVMLRGEKVSASLWAERDETASLMDEALPVLESSLATAGLEVGALACTRGHKKSTAPEFEKASLLDYRV